MKDLTNSQLIEAAVDANACAASLAWLRHTRYDLVQCIEALRAGDIDWDWLDFFIERMSRSLFGTKFRANFEERVNKPAMIINDRVNTLWDGLFARWEGVKPYDHERSVQYLMQRDEVEEAVRQSGIEFWNFIADGLLALLKESEA